MEMGWEIGESIPFNHQFLQPFTFDPKQPTWQIYNRDPPFESIFTKENSTIEEQSYLIKQLLRCLSSYGGFHQYLIDCCMVRPDYCGLLVNTGNQILNYRLPDSEKQYQPVKICGFCGMPNTIPKAIPTKLPKS